MDEKDWLEGLNEQQRKAVTFGAAPLLVLAGPGSGKTRIITRRIAWLVEEEGEAPERILAVTFTNRAAEEMKERLFSFLGDKAEGVWIHTFHAAAMRILRKYGDRIDIPLDFVILDEDEQRLQVARYDIHPPFYEDEIPITNVTIPLQQHIGQPALAVVNTGDPVKKGDLIGEIPEGALGARVHASIDGIVTAVDDTVVIEKRQA